MGCRGISQEKILCNCTEFSYALPMQYWFVMGSVWKFENNGLFFNARVCIDVLNIKLLQPGHLSATCLMMVKCVEVQTAESLCIYFRSY